MGLFMRYSKIRLGGLALAVGSTMLFSQLALAGNLPIFYPSALSAKEREKGVKDELGKAGVDVTVYAKYKDFEEAMGQSPEAVIAPDGFDKQFPEYVPAAQFKKGEKTTFKYVFFSMSQKVSEGDFPKQKIGLVELLDRDKLKDFMKDISGKDFSKIKSVSKPEDLFPLLVFQSADVVVIAPDDYEKLKEKFTTKVYNVRESKEVRYPILFVKKGFDGKQLVEAFSKLTEGTAKEMGFTGTSLIGGVK